MKKVFLVFMGLMLIMCLAGCNTINKDDFECIIDVDKTNVKVGETIKIRASIKNDIKKSIKIQAAHTDFKKIEDTIMIGVFNEFEDHDFIINSKGGPLKKFKIEKDTVIEKELEYEIISLNNLEIEAQFYFYINNELVTIKSNVIRICVEQ